MTICKYSERCNVFMGKNKKTNKPLFIYHNIFCKAGPKGFYACKRFEIYEMELEPFADLIPENQDSIEIVISKCDSA